MNACDETITEEIESVGINQELQIVKQIGYNIQEYWSKIDFLNYSQTTDPEVEGNNDAHMKDGENSFGLIIITLNLEARTGHYKEAIP